MGSPPGSPWEDRRAAGPALQDLGYFPFNSLDKTPEPERTGGGGLVIRRSLIYVYGSRSGRFPNGTLLA